ncbi:unnamed protein product, partial [Didymodactylos carnosus]
MAAAENPRGYFQPSATTGQLTYMYGESFGHQQRLAQPAQQQRHRPAPHPHLQQQPQQLQLQLH